MRVLREISRCEIPNNRNGRTSDSRMDDLTWRDARLTATEYLGRACARVDTVDGLALGIADVELEDGVVELDLAVEPERGFHGVVWRVQDDENYESFFVRPHQVGNHDSIQYTPVFNGSSAWQLYHGDGFWAPISFPLGDWFRIRVVFSGARAEVFVGDLETPALAIRELKRPAERGRIGVMVGGPVVHLEQFAHDTEVGFRRAAASGDGARRRHRSRVVGVGCISRGGGCELGARGAHVDAARRRAVRPGQPGARERNP